MITWKRNMAVLCRPHSHTRPLVNKEELPKIRIYGSKKLVQLKPLLIPAGKVGHRFTGIDINPMEFR